MPIKISYTLLISNQNLGESRERERERERAMNRVKKLPHNHRKFEINCHVWKIDDGSQIATNQRAETILIRRYHAPCAYKKFVYTCVNT